MNDPITKLVNNAADLRNELSDTRYAHMNKTTVVHSHAMGILKLIMDQYFKPGWYFRTDEHWEIKLHMDIQMAYDWLEYSHGLPASKFAKLHEGTRVWYAFRDMYEMYKEANTDIPFNEWMQETEQKTDHAS